MFRQSLWICDIRTINNFLLRSAFQCQISYVKIKFLLAFKGKSPWTRPRQQVVHITLPSRRSIQQFRREHFIQ